MSRRRPQLVVIVAVLFATLTGSRAQAEGDSGVPRYRFEVGQELIYLQTNSEERASEDADQTKQELRTEYVNEWHIYPVRQNDDGSWRLLVRRIHKILDVLNDPAADWNAIRFVRESGNIPQPGQPRVQFENDYLAYCDLHANGAYEMNDTLGEGPRFAFHPEELFCQLPNDEREQTTGWTYEPPVSHAEFDLHATRNADGVQQFAGPCRQWFDASYAQTVTVAFTFDPQRGLPTKIVRETKNNWSPTSWRNTRTTVELVGTERRDEGWFATFARECDAYFKLKRDWNEASQQAYGARTKGECVAAFDKVRQQIAERRGQATLPESREVLDALLAYHDRESQIAIEAASKREAIYAEPSVDWETSDLDDKPVRQVDYRGQVVLLDIWQRGCRPCILAMPKINRLAIKYEGQPVTVFSVHCGSDVDARLGIEQYNVQHRTLRDGEIATSYQVRYWPTYVLLDQTGRVALFLDGNSDHLEVTLDRAISDLLANPVPAS
jgi:thiol-disulfide isomerase/thioredoxin